MKKSGDRHFSTKEVKNIRKETQQNVVSDSCFIAWNPMEDTFNSPLNRFKLGPEDVSGAQHCIYYDGISEACLMGDNCRALHVKETWPRPSGSLVPEKKFSKPGVSKVKRLERVSCAYDLDRRGVAAPASVFKAVVSYAENPSTFFVVPQFDLNCACTGICSPRLHIQKLNSQQKPSSNPNLENDSRRTYSGIEGYNAIVKETTTEMGKRSETNRYRNDYEELELVAFNANSVSVLVKNFHRPLWLRGVLSGPVYAEEGNKGFTPAEVFLFDNGRTVTTNTRDIRQLPTHYSKISPFAIRCELYGIRPKCNSKTNQGKSAPPQWSTNAIKDFEKLVKSPGDLMSTQELQTKNLVIVEVKKSPCTDSDGVFQPTPYSMMITIAAKDNNGKTVNVSEEMVKMGHAEFTNFNPECGYSFSEWEFLNPLSSL